MGDDGWSWELAPKAQDDLVALDAHEQDRILDKLDDIVDSRGVTHRITASHSGTVLARRYAWESFVSR